MELEGTKRLSFSAGAGWLSCADMAEAKPFPPAEGLGSFCAEVERPHVEPRAERHRSPAEAGRGARPPKPQRQAALLSRKAASLPSLQAIGAHTTKLLEANFVNVHCHGDKIDQLKEHMVLYSFELSLEGVD